MKTWADSTKGQEGQHGSTGAPSGTISADDLAELLGISVGSVYVGAGNGEIPCRRVGRRFIFWRETIYNWLKQDRGSHSEDS
mgnify:CR=1 FL=1